MGGQIEIAAIDALAELDRLGRTYEQVGNDEVKLLCPVHDDQTPSVRLNVAKNEWRCFACSAKGDVVTLLAHIAGINRDRVLLDLSSRYEIEVGKTIRPDVVEKYHNRIYDAEAAELVAKLRERAISDEIIREHRLGFHDGRITIPVYDLAGNIVNVRKYLPGGPSDKKMRNTPGYGRLRLYQVGDAVKYDSVWVCGGEMKALVVKKMLNEKGIGACSPTAGEGNWAEDLNRFFNGKKVYVCMDVDRAGRLAARKVALPLSAVAEKVYILALPLDREKYPKGDLNDFIAAGGTVEQLLQLMQAAEEFVPDRTTAQVEKGLKETRLSRIADPDAKDWRLKFQCVTSAVDMTPYLVPADINVTCSRKETNCSICPIKLEDPDEKGFVKQRLSTSNKAILEIVGAPKQVQNEALREGLGIPTCKSVEFDIRTHHRVVDARLAPKLEIMGDNEGGRVTPALIVNAEPELNMPFVMSGRVYPHPKTQLATLVIDDLAEAEDSLTSFSPSAEELAELRIFRPPTWSEEGLQLQLDNLYTDIEANVTRIFGRRDLHLLIDLTYHSPLFLKFDGNRVNGWVSSLIIGDSAQGKSETCLKLQGHYGLGERIECKNASVAGLLGGLQQMGTRWFVSWGVIPMHDKRLVILEEIKGASTEVIAKLTDMRSSGIAEIPKIERRRTHARTRMICISNPRSTRPMRSYSYGIEAIKELIGSLEDLRRFDAALIVTNQDVSLDTVLQRPVVEHRFLAELCHRLILWAWTLDADHVKFESGALDRIGHWSNQLSETFTESLPLVDRGTVRFKIARLASALAARTFSEDDGNLIVRSCHVDYVGGYLLRMYSEEKFGYSQYTSSRQTMDRLLDSDSLRRVLYNQWQYKHSIVTGLLSKESIDVNDLQSFAGVERQQAESLLSLFVRAHGLYRDGTGYSKSVEFVRFLKNMKEELENKGTVTAVHDEPGDM